jgi:hypothetical protein
MECLPLPLSLGERQVHVIALAFGVDHRCVDRYRSDLVALPLLVPAAGKGVGYFLRWDVPGYPSDFGKSFQPSPFQAGVGLGLLGGVRGSGRRRGDRPLRFLGGQGLKPADPQPAQAQHHQTGHRRLAQFRQHHARHHSFD